MWIYKTRSRTITTLQGSFIFRIKERCCPIHKEESRVRSDILDNLAPNGRKYGIDLVIAIGLLRWGLCLQRDQVKGYLQRRGIKISTGMISYLSIDFLLLIKQIHLNGKDSLENWFHKNGGMIIHTDATDEKGGNTLFQIKESRTGITLYSESMISERAEYITPVLRDFKEYYGTPSAIVRDMGSAIIRSCKDVFPDVPNQICHYHFINALGKRIFKDIYDELSSDIVATKVIYNLRYLRKSVRLKLKESSVIFNERHELYWLHIIIDHLLYPLRNPLDFPFRLPYLEFYERVKEVSDLLSSDEGGGRVSILKIKQYNTLVGQVSTLLKNKKVRKKVETISVLKDWYCNIRMAMRLIRKDLGEKREFSYDEIKKMKDKLRELIDNIVIDGEERGGIFQKKSKIITGDFNKRWDGLFVELRDNNGNYIPLRRDNNIDEQAHRWIRMGFRRRTGRSRTQNELYQLGSLLAYFSNLFNENYRRIILDKKDCIMMGLLALDWQGLPFERRKLFLFSDGVNIPLRDEKRAELIVDFMQNTRGIPDDGYLENWLKKMTDLVCPWEMDFLDVNRELDEIYSTLF